MKRKASKVLVGDSFETKADIGRYQPIFYAGASGDFNPIHIDPEFGKMVGLGGAVLQGLCTMAITARAHIDWAGDPAALKKIKVRFSKPVYPEDEVIVKSRVTVVNGKAIATEFNATNQNGVEVLTRAFTEIELD
jgi:3-hydroxybutyryl-CoA dehydratase